MLLSTETFFNSFVSLIFVWILVNYRSYLLRAIKTVPRDIQLKILYIKYKKLHIYNLYELTIKKYGQDKIACILDDVHWRYKDLKDFCDRAANVYLSLGLTQNDHIALFSETTAFYSQIWLAGDKIGLATGLINHSLRNESLAHSLNEVKPKLIIASASLAKYLEELKLEGNPRVAIFDENITTQDIEERKRQGLAQTSDTVADLLTRNPGWLSFDKLISHSEPLGAYRPKTYSSSDPILFIFTSGTTGLPKAAVISLARYYLMSFAPHYFLKMNSSDIVYTTLPLYHSAGGIVGVGQCILSGMCQVLRKKFSASQFWNDCVKYECTVIQYIGEICRYLLAQPYQESERKHQVRLAFGNGIRPKVWKEFVNRYNVSKIGEFYGATESCANFINSTNQFGAIGFSSIIIPCAYPAYLIKTDLTTGEIIRDPITGFCSLVDYNEPGQLIGKIKNSAAISFEGYLNKKDNQKKIAHDVFKKGDKWFLSGDILEQDEYGYYYFKDRLGDTFRWRGENVSTNEVESVISHGVDLNDCVVYGVSVPNCEGKAGMAAIVLNPNDDKTIYKLNSLTKSKDSGISVLEINEETSAKSKLEFSDPNKIERIITNLKLYMEKNLPPYAHPLFIRICKNISLTSTFKMKKINLMNDGFNPRTCQNDYLFYLNTANKTYEILSEKVYKNITNGVVRF